MPWYLWSLLWWLPSLLFLVDAARNRRELYWIYLLIALGPFGALAYLLYHYESITFPFPIARTLRQMGQRPVARRCPRCGEMSTALDTVVDGRQSHLMCPACASQLESLGRG